MAQLNISDEGSAMAWVAISHLQELFNSLIGWTARSSK